MSDSKRLIGDGYDRQKFEAGFKRAAYAMASDSYASPDTPTGKTLQEMFVAAMERTMSRLPIMYYQMLETIADGGDVSVYADGSALEKFENVGDAKLARIMMEMTDETDIKSIHIKNPYEAERYYNEKFPELAAEKGKFEKDGVRRKIQISQKGERSVARTRAGKKQKLAEKAEKTIDEPNV